MFQKAHILSLKEDNYKLWLQGAYFNHALAITMNNAFSKSKDKYPDKPFEIFPKTKREKEAEAAEERAKIVAYLNNFKAAWERKQNGS